MHMLVEALQPVALGHKLHLLGALRVAFGNRNVALGHGFAGQRAQALNIVRERISCRAHTPSRAHSRENAMHLLSLTLAKNWTGLSGTRYAEHRIVFDDFMSALEHEFHAAKVSEAGPATFGI